MPKVGFGQQAEEISCFLKVSFLLSGQILTFRKGREYTQFRHFSVMAL
jgi:hypothetical protein